MSYRFARAATLLALMLLIAQSAVAANPAAVAPAGFVDEALFDSGTNAPVAVDGPTALAFTPDGRLLITQQTGELRVYQNGALLATPALDLTVGDAICSDFERGLLGVAVDPDFATNHYIYLYYTFKKHGVCPEGDPTSASIPVNRVSRFVLSDQNVASGETMLVDNMPSSNGNHNAGGLHFGQDGYLYISVGDGGADYAGDSGSAGSNDASRDQFILLGKILRITRDGGIPADNPFQDPATSARCNVTGRTDPAKKCRETFAWGLRNPFRFTFKPGSNEFYINDVGQNAREEIDVGQAGADYGWNCREGTRVNSTSGKCNPTPAGMIDPIYEYDHAATGCDAITGGAFVPPGIWPSQYDNIYLFSDYVCGKIFQRAPNGVVNEFVTGMGNSSATTLVFGPYNATQALYYTTYANGGQIHRLFYNGNANRSPSAVLDANPRFGAAPLSVSFSAAGSSDPDGDPLTYDWDFGDGSAHASGVTTTHLYAEGTYTATLRVSDGRGGQGVATARIDSGNSPPLATIETPLPGDRFAVGQTITLHGSAIDPEDGALDDSHLSWRVILHHNDHTHPYLPPTSGNDVPFTAPAPEDLAATAASYLEIELTATDSLGLSSVVTQTLLPRLVDVTFATVPDGLRLLVNGDTITATRTLISWEGYTLNVVGPAQQTDAGQWLRLASWNDGGPVPDRAIVTPSAAVSYTATFAPAQVMLLPVVAK